MAIEQRITVSFPDAVLDAIERSRKKLWRRFGVIGNEPSDWSRAQVVEFLVLDGLSKLGVSVKWDDPGTKKEETQCPTRPSEE